MHRFFFACLFLVALCVAAPVSAFVDRNGITSAAEFGDYVPSSYIKSAGITDSMTVDTALDKYITYALSFSSPTAYAYISQLSSPAQVKIHAGGSTTSASRGDVVAEGWNIEVGDKGRVAIRYPGGVLHTITGPYTYTVPAYGKWGQNAVFGLAPVGTNSRAISTLPDTTGYSVVKRTIDCRGIQQQDAYRITKVSGTVYAVHYSQNPAAKEYFAYQVPAGTTTSCGDDVSIVAGPASSALIEQGLDIITVPEKTVFELNPRFTECMREMDVSGKPTGQMREKTFFDSIFLSFGTFWNSITKTAEDIIKIPTATAGVRG
ncbi:MAG: hypothetical protein ABFC78_07250 [Methanoregula sp.]